MSDIVDIGLSVDSRQVTRGTHALDKFGKESLAAERSTSQLNRTLSRGTLIVEAFAAATAVGLTVALFKATEAAAKQEAVEAQLAQALISTGKAAGLSKTELLDMASGLQTLTTFGDEAVIGAEALLLTFTNIKKDVFPGAIQTVLDMSTALGQDLKSSAIQLGKALNDPILGITALSRVGVSFTEDQKNLIKTLTESGRTMEAQKLILKELNTEFGGQAAAQASTYAGKIQKLKNVFGDFEEKIGAELIPTLGVLADKIADFLINNESIVDAVHASTAAFKAFLKVIGVDLRGELETIGDARIQMEVLTGAVKQNQAVINASSLTGNIDEVYRFTLANQELEKKIATLSASIGEQEQAYIEAHGVIERNIKITKTKTKTETEAVKAARELAKVTEDINKKIEEQSLKLFTLLGAKSDVLAIEAQELVNMGASTAQLQEYLNLRTQQIAVESAVTEEKKRQQEADANALVQQQALKDLQTLQANDPLAVAPDNELSRLQETQNQKLAMVADHNALVIQAQINAGMSLDTIQATFAQQSMAREKQLTQFKVQQASTSFGMAANFMQNLTVIAGKEGGAMFKVMKAFAIGQAVMDTFAAANKAMASVPFPFNFAAAAATVVAGLARVAQIQATQPGATSGNSVGGGGVTNPSFTGGSNTAGPPPVPVTQINKPQPINIIINNNTNVESVLEGINDLVDKGAHINIKQVGG